MIIPSEELPAAKHGAFKLIAGTRVIDLTNSIAGPYATMLLGDFGAEVIKIERPGGGDDSRAWIPPAYGGFALWYLSVNRNKKSITLDYSRPEGRELLHALVRSADVLVTNQVARVQRKLAIDYDAMRAVRPDIVFVSITGFGLEGERSDDPCYDLIAEGYSGVMDLTGEAESGPQKVGTPAADLLAGADAAMACLAALVDRERSGQGHLIDVSLVESMTRFMAPRITSYLGTGDVPRRSGARDSVIAIYQVFATADEPLTLGLPTEAIWQRFCQAVGRADLASSQSYKGNSARVERRAELVAEIGDILKARPRAYWLDLFKRERIPAGPINRVDQITADRELIERGLFYSIPSGPHALPQVGLGIHVDGRSAGYEIAPPALGAHTNEILAGLLNMPEDRIAQLKQAGVI